MKIDTGFILIVILALLGVLAAITLGFVNHSYFSQKSSRLFLDQMRSTMLAQSGVQYALHYSLDVSSIYKLDDTIQVGEGTYKSGGDVTDVISSDSNGKININDGIQAGNLEEPVNYVANNADPWAESINFYGESGGAPRLVQVNNLRLLRLLNAYGDVHRFVDHVFDDEYFNCSDQTFYKKDLPKVVFSTRTPPFYVLPSSSLPWQAYLGSADGPRDFTVSHDKVLTQDPLLYNNGLGDRIIEMRPQSGYASLDEIEDLVNQWAKEPGIDLSDEYLEEKTFFQFIENDLTVSSYEDDRLVRLQAEYADYRYVTPTTLILGQPFITHGLFRSSKFLKDYDDISFPRFKFHSVPPINLNTSSFFVKAAVFYAPTNVSYFTEQIGLELPYYTSQFSTNFGNDFFDRTTAVQSMVPDGHKIGVSPPLFKIDALSRENGHDVDFFGNPAGRQSHLMSLRDAMYLANQYENYTIDLDNQILNFDDFRDFLQWHESNSTQEFPSFERVHPIEAYNQKFDGYDFNAGGLFHVSDYLDDSVYPAHSEFAGDYISKTLPHIFSCVRRIPSYLGAPLALQSPYIVMRSSAQDPNNISVGVSRKVEDFVWRAPIPKVCFLSSGHVDIQATGFVWSKDDRLIAQSSVLKQSAVLFETKYYRSQSDFLSITVTADDVVQPIRTHDDILIGPEHYTVTNIPSPYIGFVGLKDFDQDVVMTDPLTDYDPQIIMNFDPEVIDDDYDSYLGYDLIGGLTNTSDNAISPQPQDAKNDDWLSAITTAGLSSTLNLSTMEGSRQKNGSFRGYHFTNGSGLCDLSPFNGASFFNTFGHHCDKDGFEDSLYWRLDDWLDPNEPIGKSVSAGVMTFWFRLPTFNDYPSPVLTTIFPEPKKFVMPRSYAYTLVSLNLWESFSASLAINPIMYRPLALTVGLRKTMERGLNVFIRYDAGGPSHSTSAPSFPYTGRDGFENLQQSVMLADPQPQYDYMNFLCQVATPQEGDLYTSYRSAAYRSTEMNLKFASVPEAGPGTWHRVSAGWNLRWPGQGILTQDNQLWIKLHDSSVQDGGYAIHQNYEPGNYVTDPGGEQNPMELDDALHYPGGPKETGGGVGFMLPFDVSMVLSLGESQVLRLAGTDTYNYVPMWRLNSCLDNFRLSMGPSDPSALKFDEKYLDPNSDIYDDSSNIMAAMRYNITRRGWHQMPDDDYREPAWVIDPQLPEDSQILSIGTRVYYPPDSNNNTSYVKLSMINQGKEVVPNQGVSKNEQDLFYAYYVVDQQKKKSTRLQLQYMAHKPKLNGDQNDIGDPLDYVNDHFTNLAWIKEFSIRYKLPSQPEIIYK